MKGICKVLIIGLLVVASSSCGRKGETPAGATEFSTGVSELSSGNMGQGGAALPQLDSLDCRSGKVRSGQFFSTLLTSLGLSASEAYDLSQACDSVFDVRTLRVGNTYSAYYDRPSAVIPSGHEGRVGESVLRYLS
jgi:hypothetical protein